MRTRPTQLYSTTRGYLLFGLTGVLVKLVFRSQKALNLGNNVRIQRLSSLVVEHPDASITIGEDSIVYENAKIESYGTGTIQIGSNCIIGDARIYSRNRIEIGNRVITSWNVFVQDYDPHPVEPNLRARQLMEMTHSFRPGRSTQVLMPIENGVSLNQQWKPDTGIITIGDDVWLGANVTILKGAQIGSGSIVATGAVVSSGVYPANSILAGVPARVIRKI